MAYGRRRSMYRRKGRRSNRSLTTRRIFNNKSAKAQASQIYALRKSVNRLRRQCRPEVKVRRSGITHDRVGHGMIYPGSQVVEQYKIYAAPLPELGNGDNARIGNMISVLPLKINFSSQYKKIINSVTTPIMSKLASTSGGVRMIVIQSKSALTNAPTINDILTDRPTTLDESVGILKSPFINGITARFNILYNRVVYYSENQLIKCKNIVVRPAIRRVRWEDGYAYPIGHIWVFLIAGGFSMVDVGSGDNPYDYDICDYSLKFEQPYTDA